MKKLMFLFLFLSIASLPVYSVSDDVKKNSIHVNSPEEKPAAPTYDRPVYYDVPVYYGGYYDITPNCRPIYCNGKKAPGYKRTMSRAACKKYYRKYSYCR